MASKKRRPGPLPPSGSTEALLFATDQPARLTRISEVAEHLRSMLGASEHGPVDELERLAREGEYWWDRAQRFERTLERARVMRSIGKNQGGANELLGLSRRGAPTEVPANAAEIFHRLVTGTGSLEIREEKPVPGCFRATDLPLKADDAIRHMAAEWDVDDEDLVARLRRDHKRLIGELASGQFLQLRTHDETRAIVASLEEKLPKLPWSTER